jgi:hypothetical protein
MSSGNVFRRTPRGALMGRHTCLRGGLKEACCGKCRAPLRRCCYFNRFHDNAFGVIWLYWSFFWALFFMLLGLKAESLGRYTGAVAAIEGWVTGAIPAFLLLTGNWGKRDMATAIALAIFGVVVFAALFPVLGRRRPGPAPSSLRLIDLPRPPPGDQPVGTIAVGRERCHR